MEVALSLLVGVLGGVSVWLMMSGQLLRLLLGVGLLSNAVNLGIFAVGRLSYAAPPLIGPDAVAPPEAVGNALPQALILTAIVISFGLFAVTLAAVYRVRAVFGTLEADMVSLTEREDPPA
jgi:multicomponent Na+:H+ antiporter subunit C